MRIIFFTKFFYPHIGGVEKHVYEISKLLKNKHEIVVVTEQYNLKLSLYEERSGIKIIRIPFSCINNENTFKKFKIWWWLWRRKKIFKNSNIIHCHDVFYWYLPFRFLYLRKPVFVTFHGYESFPLKISNLIVRKISEKLASGNICVGDFIKKWYSTKPNCVTYGGVETNKNVKQLNVYKNAIFIGRLDEQTGILLYLEALKIIKTKFPKFNLTVLGDGKYRGIVKRESRFFGFKKNTNLYFPRYRFAFVSRYLSILEAMYMKKLVFAVYDNDIKKDYLKMSPFNKFIVTTNSPRVLAERVLYFLEHREEEKIVTEKAFNWVKNQSWKNVVNDYLKLWSREL